MNTSPKRVAALVTEYRRHSHADVIVGKIPEGYLYDGKEGPDLRVVSMYVDQFPGGDMSRDLAKKYKFTITKTIDEALTLGGKNLAVDGVLCIGEHGKYPTNQRGQILYPCRRFFQKATNTLARVGRSVPVFNDKHLAATWEDGLWMYQRARQLFVPLLAGSSLPVTWRRPALTLPRHCEIVEAVQVGYGPFEGYGFHALESLQCMVERRRGGESGVRAVQCLQGEEMWRAMDRGVFSRALLEAALARVPAHAQGDYRQLTQILRKAARALAATRDAYVKAEALNALALHFRGQFAPGAIRGVRGKLRKNLAADRPDRTIKNKESRRGFTRIDADKTKRKENREKIRVDPRASAAGNFN